MRRAFQHEKASFRTAVIWAVVSLVFWGGGTLIGQWKTRMLMATGQWPQHYGEAFIYPAVGTFVALIGAVGMLGFFIRWLKAVRFRRRLAAVECAHPSAFQR
jgi:cell division protein FtsX